LIQKTLNPFTKQNFEKEDIDKSTTVPELNSERTFKYPIDSVSPTFARIFNEERPYKEEV